MAETATQQAAAKVFSIGVDQTTESARAWARDGVQVLGISGEDFPEAILRFQGNHHRQPLAAPLPSLPAFSYRSTDLPEVPPNLTPREAGFSPPTPPATSSPSSPTTLPATSQTKSNPELSPQGFDTIIPIPIAFRKKSSSESSPIRLGGIPFSVRSDFFRGSSPSQPDPNRLSAEAIKSPINTPITTTPVLSIFRFVIPNTRQDF